MRDLLAKLTARLGIYSKVVAFLNRIIEKKEAAKVKKHGVEVLALVDRILTEHGSKAFLSFGLLLGAYRDKGFIPYDYDLDLGILASERPDDIVEIMCRNGFKVVRQSYFKEDNRITIDQFSYNGVPVDFYYFFENDNEGKFTVYVPDRHEYKDWKTANSTDGFPTKMILLNKSGFSRHDFLGANLYMPDEAESWLKDNYGDDFMTPIKNWTIGERKTTRYDYPKRQYRNEEIVKFNK